MKSELCLVALHFVAGAARAQVVPPAIPQIEGAWWQVAGNPDLGVLSSPWQQPVDFSIWQARDGTWQLWSCVRFTWIGGMTRLFHRWEGRQLTDPHWKAMGIAMVANDALGEIKGGLQAPHVFQDRGVYYMVYGDYQRICLARSDDGKEFKRVLNRRGQPDLFTGPYDQTRDPMVLEVGGLHHCYYMGNLVGAQYPGAVFARTSHDLVTWSPPTMVAAGGIAGRFAGDCECPFVVAKNGLFYLFRTQVYGPNGLTTLYAAPNPLDFGVGSDRHRIGTLPVAAPEVIVDRGQYYLAALNPYLDGIRVVRLRWAAR